MASLDYELAGASSGKRAAQKTDEPKAKRQRRPSTSGQEKPPKDPNAPKKPMSSYFLWLNKERASITEAAQAEHHEKPNPKQFAAAAADAWKVLPGDKKRKVEKKALELKTEWHTQMEAYKKTPEFEHFQEQLAEFKANQASRDRIAVATRTEAQSALSDAELATTLSDDALINELRCRMARSAKASTGDHAAAAVEPTVLPLSQEGQKVTTFQKTPGYKAWYDDRGKAKIKKDMGEVPKEVIRLESERRWLKFSESRRAKWETAANA
jgi:hypothetical protein